MSLLLVTTTLGRIVYHGNPSEESRKLRPGAQYADRLPTPCSCGNWDYIVYYWTRVLVYLNINYKPPAILRTLTFYKLCTSRTKSTTYNSFLPHISFNNNPLTTDRLKSSNGTVMCSNLQGLMLAEILSVRRFQIA